MKDRLSKIITSEGLTPSLLAEKMGVQRSGISHILSGRNYPSFDFLQKLLLHFPKLNADWLLVGQGGMYKSTDEPFVPPEKVEKTPLSPTIPEIPQILSSAEGSQKKLSEIAVELSPPAELKKMIEKVIVFYTDKTFGVYLPES